MAPNPRAGNILSLGNTHRELVHDKCMITCSALTQSLYPNQDRKSDRTRQENTRGDIEKWDQTDSPEIPDRGRHQKSPGLPLGVPYR